MRITFLNFVLILIVNFAAGQSNTTELFLVNIISKGDSISFSTPVNITNHEGYDNQPVFSSDSKRILYISMPDTLQTDIFEYTISDSTRKQLTLTDESEYSPLFSPDNNHISFVRIDADKGQRIYQTTFEFDEPIPVNYVIDSTAYYNWISDSTLAIAFLNNGMDLMIYEMNEGQYVVIDKGIGRCILKVPGTSDLVYTKKTDDKVSLMRYTAETGASTTYCEGLGDVEDYFFTPDGKLLAGQNGKLFTIRPEKDKTWKEIADFSKSAGSFYRLAVSPDGKRLALVTYKGKRP